ncbi:hypothetical protein GQ457_13G029500 [Hibiscus cannabinus]
MSSSAGYNLQGRVKLYVLLLFNWCGMGCITTYGLIVMEGYMGKGARMQDYIFALVKNDVKWRLSGYRKFDFTENCIADKCDLS